MHTAAFPPPPTDDVVMPAILRDGTTAAVRLTNPTDSDAVRRFFHELSPESRRKRFFTLADPPAGLIDAFCDSSDPSKRMTLLVSRIVECELQPIAIGSYISLGSGVAEAAFAVHDSFQRKGLGTILLERLAAIAAVNGFRQFEACVLPENAPMLEVFHDSGFEIRSKSQAGCINVQLALRPTSESIASAERRRAMATVTSLHPLFAPKSVAVVGASRDPQHIGRRILHALVSGGYTGAVYPVNRHLGDMEGLVCYPSLSAAPRDVDLAVVAVPKHAVLDVVDECSAAGVKALIVISAGFAETGDEGRTLQQRVLQRVRGYGMRMVGPNCMGVLNTNPEVRLNASFSPIVPPAGRVGLMSQSGALGMAILELATERSVGLSAFVSVGNKADVSGNDLLEYWEADPKTSVIVLYLESFGNPRRFARLARRIGRTKPIIAVKAGRTIAGSRAAGSHTAALAASDTAVDALFEQSGVIRAGTIDELFDIAALLDSQPLPAGRRVAIVTNAGGPGILAVDACEAAGLTVAPFAAVTQERLRSFLPPEASVNNPIDMVASAGADAFRRGVEVAMTAEDADAVIVIFTPVDPGCAAQTVEAIRDGIAAGRAAGAAAKPVLACLMAGPGRPQPVVVGSEHVPAYGFPENAARALAKAASYAEWRARTPGLLWRFDDVRVDEARTICRCAIDARGDGWLTGDETHALLGAFGLPPAAGAIARTPEDAAALARVLGLPVAAKLATRLVQHKTDVGGVKLNLTSEHAVRKAFVDIMARGRALAPERDIDGVLIQAMIVDGVETMIGVMEDPLFGPLVAFGLGGIHVEVLADVRFRIAPLTDRDADELLHGIRGVRLLEGYRGHLPADLAALHEMLLRVSRLAVDVPEIAEVDLNPVIALAPGRGCRIVDARVRVRAPRM